MLDNSDQNEKIDDKKIILTHRVWYEIEPSIYNYIKLYRFTNNIIE